MLYFVFINLYQSWAFISISWIVKVYDSTCILIFCLYQLLKSFLVWLCAAIHRHLVLYNRHSHAFPVYLLQKGGDYCLLLMKKNVGPLIIVFISKLQFFFPTEASWLGSTIYCTHHNYGFFSLFIYETCSLCLFSCFVNSWNHGYTSYVAGIYLIEFSFCMPARLNLSFFS